MAFPRLSASMLLASWILLLYWTTSSAGSHDLSAPYRVKRDLPFETRPQVEKSLEVAKDIISVINEKIGSVDSKSVKNVMKSLSTIAGLVPGIGTLIVPTVNWILALIPQDDPVLNEVKKGFDKVNRKLDSLSIQISNLATDVEWFNYASVYSQDEVCILNAWKKFIELQDNSPVLKSEEDKLRLAEIFVNYYENTGTEGSVANLFHYLTVSNTSLIGNLNDLLKKKFKCDIQKIGDYNIHFSTLMWRGMLLNQFYWKLIGFDLLDKETEHTDMIKKVYTAQISTIDYCLDNYEQYLKEDVEVIRKSISHENKKAVAEKLKRFLDKKYYWYNWVVMVHADKDSYHELYNMKKFRWDTITVAVDYIQKAEEINKTQVITEVEKCYKPEPFYLSFCIVINKKTHCSGQVNDVNVTEFFKAVHASYDLVVQVPEPMKTFKCDLGGYEYDMYFYYSRKISVCSNQTCDGGKCKQLMDSNEHLCLCPDGYRRESCVEREKPRNVTLIGKDTVPDITTINGRLKKIEDKLDVILNKTLLC
ncbi:SE-cephalotoxin-like isoform X1 [Centropristis striata]|uniref:SE-cephalotoxin-like isoform X1 n=1 Tax=Centropristis striata TaxID=184440 RepID=UPI0027E0FFE9|nr:SE-cephalotoxin-like isoform X1 [Centropristis striata]